MPWCAGVDERGARDQEADRHALGAREREEDTGEREPAKGTLVPLDEESFEEPGRQQHEGGRVRTVEKAPRGRSAQGHEEGGKAGAAPSSQPQADAPGEEDRQDVAGRTKRERERDQAFSPRPAACARARSEVWSRLVAPVEGASPRLYWNGWPSAMALAYWHTR